MNEAKAYLLIVKFSCSVEELTRRIGLQPTETWHVGEPIPLSTLTCKFNAWHLQSRLPPSESVEQHIINVLDQLRGHEGAIRGISDECQVIMECVGHFYDYYPGFTLEAGALRRLGECGACIDLDFYDHFADNESSDT